MGLVIQLALRNLWRQRRRNTLVLLAIVLSIGGVFVMNSLSRGMEAQFLTSSLENLRGHIKILHPQQLDEPGLKFLFDADVDSAVLQDSRIDAWTPRLRTPAVIMSERETRGVEIVGIDPMLETHSFIRNVQLAGQPLESAEDQVILIGQALSEELKTTVGRRLVVLMTGPNETSVEIGYRVVGTFDAETNAQEEMFVFTGLHALQELVGSNAFSEISVHLKSDQDLPAVQASLASSFSDLDVKSWLELDPFTGEMYQLIGFTIYILIGVFLCTLVFGLINALVTAVLERAREFGMLRAVGMTSRLVVTQVVIECVILMLFGLVLGIGAGLLIYLWLEDGIDLSGFAEGLEAFSMSTLMVPKLIVDDFIIITIASVVLGLIASYFPARRIIKTSILQSLRDS